MVNAQSDSFTPRLIVGMSRAGTTWLCKCLNEHPDVAAFGESMFFGRNHLEPRGDGTYGPAELETLQTRLLEHGTCIHSVAGRGPGCLKRVGLDEIAPLVREALSTDAAPLTPAEAFDRLAGAIARAEGKPGAVEKTPHHLNWIDRIVAAIPDARFVVMVREPYGFMASYKHQGDRQPQRIRRSFERRYHPFGCATVWKGYMRAAKRAKAARPTQVEIVCFEELRGDPAGVLDRVQRFFGLTKVELADAIPPDNTSFPEGKRPELAPEDLFWMNRLAGATVRACGFSVRPAGWHPARIAWSIVRLPFWAVRNFFSLRRRISGSTLAYLARWWRGPDAGRGRNSGRLTNPAD